VHLAAQGGAIRVAGGATPPLNFFLSRSRHLVILLLGGRFVIFGGMTLGDFTAFNSYLALLIFPIILLGFMSNVMAQAGVSYMRLGAGRRRKFDSAWDSHPNTAVVPDSHAPDALGSCTRTLCSLMVLVAPVASVTINVRNDERICATKLMWSRRLQFQKWFLEFRQS
jgi:hypothetical protein